MDIGLLIADTDSDRDSALDMGDVASHLTVQSAVLRYRQENGRTYHAYKDGKYLLPNDQWENERLELQHYIFLLTFNDRLHLSPLPTVMHHVLDAGCGTGDWAIDFADAHPEAHITGVDLSPIQPVFIPPNVTFLVEDIEDTWTFHVSFDFVFSRFMTGSISNWPKFFEQSYASLRPGGIIEVQDTAWFIETDDDTVPPDSQLLRWVNLMRETWSRHRGPLDSAIQYVTQLQAAGFVDIVQHKYKWPTNWWPKDRRHKQLGTWNNENIANGMMGFSLALFTRPREENGLGWTVEALEELLSNVKAELDNSKIHAYFPIYVVYAKKPL